MLSSGARRTLSIIAVALLQSTVSTSVAEPGDDSGIVKGRVLFLGEVPPRERVSMESDPVCGGALKHGIDDRYSGEVVVHKGGLANVMVYISAGLGNQQFVPPADSAVLRHAQCVYKPHVLGVMVGQSVHIRNGDNTLHNTHAFAVKNRQINIAQPTAGKTQGVVFTQEEIVIPVSCDIHGWEIAYIGVFSHPYFAVTDSVGSFSIAGLPPGTYTLNAWHEKFGTQEQKIVVGPEGASEISFTYKSSE
jgi:plastocyanin